MATLPDINQQWGKYVKSDTKPTTTTVNVGGTSVTTNGKAKINIFNGQSQPPKNWNAYWHGKYMNIPVRAYTGGSGNVFNQALQTMRIPTPSAGGCNTGCGCGTSIFGNGFVGGAYGGVCFEPYKLSTTEKLLVGINAVGGPQNALNIVGSIVSGIADFIGSLFGGGSKSDNAQESGLGKQLNALFSAEGNAAQPTAAAAAGGTAGFGAMTGGAAPAEAAPASNAGAPAQTTSTSSTTQTTSTTSTRSTSNTNTNTTTTSTQTTETKDPDTSGN